MAIDLKDKKIAILGYGVEGKAVEAYLLSKNILVSAILDQTSDPNYLDKLNDFDVLFRSPGVPRNHPKLLAFKNQENIYSQTKLFFDLCPCPIIAVTGTKGKTTTTSLIFEIVKTSGKNAFLGGNIGEPLFNFIDKLDVNSVAVIELSSFQCQDLHKSPHVGVILNVTHDHLDNGTYRPSSHSSLEEYMQAKAQLIANQTPDDFAILHPALSETFTKSGLGKKVIFNPEDVVGYETKLIGKHNFENIAAAVKACQVFGIDDETIKNAVAEFKGVAQRLELVAEKNGIKYVNDSSSTNPDSTAAAIDAFDSNIILIIGGSDKQLDYTELGKKIVESDHIKTLIIIGDIAPQISEAVSGFKGEILIGAQDMSQIMKQVRSVAKSGDVVLLSPAAASFGMFKNSKDRGQQFNEYVGAE